MHIDRHTDTHIHIFKKLEASLNYIGQPGLQSDETVSKSSEKVFLRVSQVRRQRPVGLCEVETASSTVNSKPARAAQ